MRHMKYNDSKIVYSKVAMGKKAPAGLHLIILLLIIKVLQTLVRVFKHD